MDATKETIVRLVENPEKNKRCKRCGLRVRSEGHERGEHHQKKAKQ